MIKIIKYGMEIHPGNPIYVAFTIMFFIAGLLSETNPWWSGLTVLIILGPLYIWTSYSVGKANWNFKKDEPK